jgi:RNA polymerase sigma-70 factor (ECF subfamily)
MDSGMSTVSDDLAALVYQTALGNQRAFEQLYRRTSSQLFGVALALLRRRELAEEVVQEAYVKAWHAAGSYQPERGSVNAWLGTIARRSAIDRLRRRGDDEDTGLSVEDFDAPVAGPLEAVLADADAARLSGCLGQLDERQSQSLAMAFMHGYTHSELAQRLQAPLGTIKAWLRRGLEKLRTCLEVAAL